MGAFVLRTSEEDFVLREYILLKDLQCVGCGVNTNSGGPTRDC